MLAAAPAKTKVEEVEEPQPRERSNTMPTIDVEEATDEVVLRVPSGPRQSPDKRKSGNYFHKINIFRLTFMSILSLLCVCFTAPPKVADKPVTKVSPEKLSFKEKLALHKKVADNSVEPAASSVRVRPKSGNDAQRQRPYSTMVIAEEAESSLKRTHSEGELDSEVEEGEGVIQV